MMRVNPLWHSEVKSKRVLKFYSPFNISKDEGARLQYLKALLLLCRLETPPISISEQITSRGKQIKMDIQKIHSPWLVNKLQWAWERVNVWMCETPSLERSREPKGRGKESLFFSMHASGKANFLDEWMGFPEGRRQKDSVGSTQLRCLHSGM